MSQFNPAANASMFIGGMNSGLGARRLDAVQDQRQNDRQFLLSQMQQVGGGGFDPTQFQGVSPGLLAEELDDMELRVRARARGQQVEQALIARGFTPQQAKRTAEEEEFAVISGRKSAPPIDELARRERAVNLQPIQEKAARARLKFDLAQARAQAVRVRMNPLTGESDPNAIARETELQGEADAAYDELLKVVEEIADLDPATGVQMMQDLNGPGVADRNAPGDPVGPPAPGDGSAQTVADVQTVGDPEFESAFAQSQATSALMQQDRERMLATGVDPNATPSRQEPQVSFSPRQEQRDQNPGFQQRRGQQFAAMNPQSMDPFSRRGAIPDSPLGSDATNLMMTPEQARSELSRRREEIRQLQQIAEGE